MAFAKFSGQMPQIQPAFRNLGNDIIEASAKQRTMELPAVPNAFNSSVAF